MSDFWLEVLADVEREDRLLRMDDESPETLRDGGMDDEPAFDKENWL